MEKNLSVEMNIAKIVPAWIKDWRLRELETLQELIEESIVNRNLKARIGGKE